HTGIAHDVGHQAGAVGVVADDLAFGEDQRVYCAGRLGARRQPGRQPGRLQLERQGDVGAAIALVDQALHGDYETVQRRQTAFIRQVLAGLQRIGGVDRRGFAVGDRVADDAVAVAHFAASPRVACILSSRVKRKRVNTSHRSSLPWLRILAGKAPNGAERRTISSAALSRAGLPELRSTLGPPSFRYRVPSWNTGI